MAGYARIMYSAFFILVLLTPMTLTGCNESSTPPPTTVTPASEPGISPALVPTLASRPKPAPPLKTASPAPKPTRTKPPAPPQKEVELKYDDGRVKDNLAHAGGFIVDFTPPSSPFDINKIRIYGVVTGTEFPKKTFDIEIMNKSYKTIWSSSYPIEKFPQNRPSWVVFDLPSVRTEGKFYTHVYTGTGRGQGIHIGADDSAANLHSGITWRTEEGTTRLGSSGWLRGSSTQWFTDRNRVNWLVRVVGNPAAPRTSAAAPTASETKPAVQISTAHQTDRELATKKALEALLAQYDVSRWIFAKSAVIDETAIPHAGTGSAITLSTAYLSYDYLNLSTFIHEQLEVFLYGKQSQVSQAITELRKSYPKVPTDNTGYKSDRTEQGTYKHLILCFLEFSAIKKLVNEETARLAMERMAHYLWVYATVLSDADKIEKIAQKYGLIIE